MKRTAKTQTDFCFVDGTPLCSVAWVNALGKLYGKESLTHDYELYSGLEEELETKCEDGIEEEPELAFDEVTGKIIDEEVIGEENDE